MNIFFPESIEKVPVAVVENIQEALDNYATTLQKHIILDARFDSKVWLRIGLDKGGTATKLSLSIANIEACQSRNSHVVVGAYFGPDSHAYLSSALGDVFDVIGKITHIRLGNESVEVVKFIIGDNKSLSAMRGHAGQSCSHPCTICTIPLMGLRQWQGESWDSFSLRSTTNDNNQRLGMRQPPLASTPALQVVPCLVHNILGPTAKVASIAYEDAAYLDHVIAKGDRIVRAHMPSWTKRAKDELKLNESLLTKNALEKAEDISKRFLQKLVGTGGG